MFYGSRGSGESFDDKKYAMGSKVYDAFLAVALATPNRRIAGNGIPYTAQSVDLLAYGRKGAALCSQGIDGGVDSLLTQLRFRSSICPKERYILAGYSQGAVVLHRVMHALARTKDSRERSAARRINGMLAIADGDVFKGQGGLSYGSKPSSSLYGISWSSLGKNAAPSAERGQRGKRTYRPRTTANGSRCAIRETSSVTTRRWR